MDAADGTEPPITYVDLEEASVESMKTIFQLFEYVRRPLPCPRSNPPSFAVRPVLTPRPCPAVQLPGDRAHRD